jgi:hypothetical protein
VVSGCETENKYKIYEKKPGEEKKKGKKKLYTAKEKSGCCSRNFLTNDCRGMDIKLTNITNLDEDKLSIKIHKPCTCTCWCFNRPFV